MLSIKTEVSVEQTMVAYLSEIADSHGEKATQLAAQLLSFFRKFAEDNGPETLDMIRGDQFYRSEKTFCQWASPNDLPCLLPRFYRVNLLRELITDSDLRSRVLSCTLDYFLNMEEQRMISAGAIQSAKDALAQISTLDHQAYAAMLALQKQIPKTKRVAKGKQVIPYARHDVVKIQSTNVWLKVWEPDVEPYGQVFGPLDVGANVVDLIEVGWMITCSITKSKGGNFKIAEPGPIYASLPFNE